MATQQAIDALVRETGGWVAANLEACTRCGLCAEACHFFQSTGDPEYAPVWKMELLRRAYEQRFTVAGRLKRALGMERITDEDVAEAAEIVFKACTLCNKCNMVCPMGIQLGVLIHEVRSGISAAGMVPEELMESVLQQEETGSPLGLDDDAWEDRIEWIADEWEVEIPVDREGADTLVVFTSIEIMKFPQNVAAIAEIMEAAGTSWTVSVRGREVVNFGVFEGSSDRVRRFASRLFDAVRALGVKRLMVTECGHAYDLLRWSAPAFPDFPDGLDVTHVVAEIDRLVREGRIRLKPGAFENGRLTFHDACKIQRRGGHIDEPRRILKALAPTSFQEMTPNREEAICCGGGGGVIAIASADENRYAAFRLKVDQLEAAGADTVVMTCANCRLQFTDGIEHFDLPYRARGLSEMVAQALEH